MESSRNAGVTYFLLAEYIEISCYRTSISSGLITDNNKRPILSSRLTSSTVFCVYFSASLMNSCILNAAFSS
jgi:hypothetical protein